MLQDMRQVPQTPSEVLGLVAHGSTVVKQHCIQIDVFAQHKLSLIILLRSKTLLKDFVPRRRSLGSPLHGRRVWFGEIPEDDLAAIRRELADRRWL